MDGFFDVFSLSRLAAAILIGLLFGWIFLARANIFLGLPKTVFPLSALFLAITVGSVFWVGQIIDGLYTDGANTGRVLARFALYVIYTVATYFGLKLYYRLHL